jgi:hypothetical protein
MKTREEVTQLMLEKFNDDTRNAGAQSGYSFDEIEERISTNQTFLIWQLNNMYDLLVEKEIINL